MQVFTFSAHDFYLTRIENVSQLASMLKFFRLDFNLSIQEDLHKAKIIFYIFQHLVGFWRV